jgi:hypothetical protein
MPAGVNGPIVVKGGHFVETKTGSRVRFLGTNFTFESIFPAHESADKIAPHLAKMGVNIVRIHHHDFNDGMLWDKTAKGHTKFDPAALDRLDYLVAQFKKNGIYVDLNLHVSRSFTADDGFPASIEKIPGGSWKRIDELDRRMIDLQKQFAKDYLGHVNPYTGMSYIDDPAVAMVEINNENSLAGWGSEDMTYFNALPEPFRGEVVAAWNGWLAKKYRSSAVMRKAWWPKVTPASRDIGDLLTSSTRWSLEDTEGDVKLSNGSASSSVSAPSVEIVNPTVANPAWHKQIHVQGLTLVNGEPLTVTFRAKSDTNRAISLYSAINQPDWHHTGLDTTFQVGPEWRDYRYTFTPSNALKGLDRLSFGFGGSTGTLSISDLRLRRANADDLADISRAFETRSMDLPLLVSPEQASDWRSFLVDTETAYADEMRKYLREDLKVRTPIVDSQMQFGTMAAFQREAGSDFTDYHAYWQHPEFPGGTWSQTRWTIPNTPMTDAIAANGSELEGMAEYRVAGKPYTITEYNEPAPNDYQAEMFPELASYAAFQDWDAIFQFDFGDYGVNRSNDRLQGFFSLRGNPAKEGLLPAVALIFRTSTIAPATSRQTLRLPATAASSTRDIMTWWRNANGGRTPDLLASRFESLVDPKAKTASITKSTAPGPLSLLRAVKSTSGSQFIAEGAGAVTGAGYVGGQTIRSGAVALTFPEFGNNFAAYAVNALDGKPLTQSTRLLLTLVGKAENADMVWDAKRTTVSNHWGHGPVLAEGIPAAVMIANKSVRRVWVLDTRGGRVKEIPVTLSGGAATFTVGPEYGTIWYELAE